MVKKYECDYCEKQFYWAISLKLHTKILHRGYEGCGYACASAPPVPSKCEDSLYSNGLFDSDFTLHANPIMYGRSYSAFEKKYNTNNP